MPQFRYGNPGGRLDASRSRRYQFVMTNTTKLEAFNQARTELEKARRESERLRADAIRELLEERKRIDSELRMLGHAGRELLSENVSARHEQDGQGRRARRAGKKPHCPYCDIDGHDGRAHRGQADGKRKFTTAELYARGLGIPPRNN
ncbi:MAG: hypothetical protein WEE89_20415 [Gemmatimonadota bacterium]